MMKRFLAVVLLLLAGCSDWNKKHAEFANYAAFAASDVAHGGFLPDDLVPHSAHDIRFVQDIDTTMVTVDFDFAEADREAMIEPFLSFEQRQLRLAIQQGIAPPSAMPPPSLLLRCGPGPIEFLSLEKPGHARYWTDTDPKLRQTACTNRAANTTAA